MRKQDINKIIPFRGKTDEIGIDAQDQMPLGKCRELLKNNSKKYTDEDILLIRDWFYKLVQITYDEYFVNQQPCIIIPLTENQNDDHEERHYLRAS
jgi:hypothetical protein